MRQFVDANGFVCRRLAARAGCLAAGCWADAGCRERSGSSLGSYQQLARKLRAVLAAAHPATTWPALSTITAVLKRAGYIAPRRRSARARGAWAATDLTPPRAPNDVWTADFKGEFRLQRGPYCYPLTVADRQSRFVVGLRARGDRQRAHPGPVPSARRARRVARRRAHRQRRAVRRPDGVRRPLHLRRLADPARHPPAAHAPRQPARERGPRADAPHAQGRNDPPPGRDLRGPAAALRPLAADVQRRAAA